MIIKRTIQTTTSQPALAYTPEELVSMYRQFRKGEIPSEIRVTIRGTSSTMNLKDAKTLQDVLEYARQVHKYILGGWKRLPIEESMSTPPPEIDHLVELCLSMKKSHK